MREEKEYFEKDVLSPKNRDLKKNAGERQSGKLKNASSLSYVRFSDCIS